jgi:hypothetical protein
MKRRYSPMANPMYPMDMYEDGEMETDKDELEAGTFHIEPESRPSANREKGYFSNDEDGERY